MTTSRKRRRYNKCSNTSKEASCLEPEGSCARLGSLEGLTDGRPAWNGCEFGCNERSTVRL
jgi:hypothetical protein